MKLIPNPAVQIFIWVSLALLVQRLQSLPLLVLSTILLALALRLCAVQLLRLLRRTRWILFSLLLIYAYTTAGVSLWPQFGILSPTREGMLDGLVQLGRLLGVLSGLAILLELLPQEQLISGLFTLAYPLRWFGLSRERIAVRLALTLEYAESAMSDTAKDWRSTIGTALQSSVTGTSHIELRLQAFGIVDALLLIVGLVVMMGVWR